MAEVGSEAAQPPDVEAGIYTETLARLYLKQGFGERALAIYRYLVAAQPDNRQLRERLQTLQHELVLDGLTPERAAPEALAPAMFAPSPRPSRHPEHTVRVQLEHWLHYLQRQRQP